MVQQAQPANHAVHLGENMGSRSIVPVLARHHLMELPNYLPRWRTFCENCDNLPKNTLRWKEPSTTWRGHPVLGFMSDTDFKDSKGSIPAEVSFRHFPPMWSYPPAVVREPD